MIDEIEQLRQQAWVGDSVLALFVRDWLLSLKNQEISPAERSLLFEMFTSNRFLSTFGEPTRVEAEIGRAYQSGGLAVAFELIKQKYLERFITSARKRGYRL